VLSVGDPGCTRFLQVEDTASAGGSTAVSPATDSAVRADSEVGAFLVGEIMADSLIAVSVGAVAAFVIVVFATLMGLLRLWISGLLLALLSLLLPVPFFRELFWILRFRRIAHFLLCVHLGLL
jgi:hypothetical protein